MFAKYLIRMDDACPTMCRNRWDRLEKILDFYKICPVVAVVPNNKDPKLSIEKPDKNFWNKVRSWQEKNWTIAMHGETHLMKKTSAEQILPFYERSEFSGLNFDIQVKKLKKAQAIFDKEKIMINTWVAPAHCFDWTTVKALKVSTNINKISDSIASQVYFKNGFYWIPQQLWTFRNMPFGLWTICLHPNQMEEKDFQIFEKNLIQFKKKIINFSDIPLLKRNRNLFDLLINAYYWTRRGKFRAGFR